jgi:hypothetical protein
MYTAIGGKSVCPNCEKSEEEDFQKVKEFISEHHEVPLSEVVKETGVSIKRITKFIREGRLEVSKGMSNDFLCESCQEPVATGKYCIKCFTTMKSELVEALRPIEVNEKRSGKMHTGRRTL